MASGAIVICGGGGGIPVVEDSVTGAFSGVEAVIDKDMTASLMGSQLGAGARDLGSVTVGELRRAHFAPGSMGPKVEAACRFVEATGHEAAIGSLERAVDVAAGRSGTRIRGSAVQVSLP